MNGDLRDREDRFGIFRGQELALLLILTAVMVAGLGALWIYSRPGHQPPAPRTVAERTPLPPPDPAGPLQGIRDETPVGVTDAAAYALLWDRVKRTPPAELARVSRNDVHYSQLFDNPGRFRGLPVHVEGTARRIYAHDDADPRVVPGGVMYEAYVFTTDSQNNPFVLSFADAPKSLSIGDDLFERVAFDGYFLKQMVFRGGDNRLYKAPLLIGRIQQILDSPSSAGGENSWLLWTVSPLIVLFLYIVARGAFAYRSLGRPATAPRGPRPVEEIDPEALAAWVDSEEDAGEGDDPGRPDDRD